MFISIEALPKWGGVKGGGGGGYAFEDGDGACRDDLSCLWITLGILGFLIFCVMIICCLKICC